MRAQLKARLNWYQERVKALGGSTNKLIFSPPVTKEAIKHFEYHLGFLVPEAYRDFLLTVSSRIEFWWGLFDNQGKALLEVSELDLPIYSGELMMGLGHGLYYERLRQDCLRTIENKAKQQDFQNKFILACAGRDFIAIDLDKGRYGKVVYLSQKEKLSHNFILADNFESYLDHYSALGCLGPHDYLWEAFTKHFKTPLEANSPKGRLWLEAIGYNRKKES